MDVNELARLRVVADAATPGPWRWRNAGETYLIGAATRIVMAFTRMGMQGAQPQFNRGDGLLYDAGKENLNDFPDAAHIATFDPPTVLTLLDEVERLTDDSKAQGAMIRELEDENTELNDELGTAVQVLKLERAGLRARLAAVEAVAADHMTGPISGTVTDWVPLDELLDALDEPTSNEPPSSPNFDAPGPDPNGGIDLTDEEFAAFIKAAKG